MLVTSIFSFSHNVFKRLLSHGLYKLGLCGKELKLLLSIFEFAYLALRSFAKTAQSRGFNSLPNKENLEWSKLKAFANDIINFLEMIITLFYRVEDIVGKGEMLVASIFSFSHNVLKGLFYPGSLKVGFVW